jgi:DNA-binding transcriptional regulator YiaG
MQAVHNRTPIHFKELKVQFSASMVQKNHTQIQETLNMVVFGLQRVHNRRLTHADMATMLGVSKRTFSEWMRDGGATPVAMEAILLMLSMLPNEDVLKIVDNWRQGISARSSSNNSIQVQGEANGQNNA